MNQRFQYVNLIGVMMLAILCGFQWRNNSRLGARLLELEQQVEEQSVKIATQQTTLQRNAADMEDLHQRITLSESQLEETARSLKRTTAERDQYRHVHDQLIAALKQRDQVILQQSDVIKTQNTSIRKLAEERNDAVAKFNDLATKYNAMMVAAKGG